MAHMLDFRERSRLRRALYAKPTLILLAVLATGVMHAAFSMYQKGQEASTRREKAVAELRELEMREKELSEDISLLSTERGVEAEIRERFMVAKEGEKVIIIAEPEEKTSRSVVVEEEASFVDKMKAAAGLSE
ncbi:MAG: hypothetical protein Q8P49_02005 [Candidatus Liptonbacteria bacterium]|nr:hypothetical protein [Candidatus Liptonbacteria bacterium]